MSPECFIVNVFRCVPVPFISFKLLRCIRDALHDKFPNIYVIWTRDEVYCVPYRCPLIKDTNGMRLREPLASLSDLCDYELPDCVDTVHFQKVVRDSIESLQWLNK
jgi:hypothetical protein